jgi:signal transduction histidine kinase
VQLLSRPLIPRSVILRHAIGSLITAAVVCTLVFTGVILFAFKDTHRSAEEVAKDVATGVVAPISRFDFSKPLGPALAQIKGDLGPFISSGIVYRVKVWAADHDELKIVYSDETALEGLVRPATFAEDRPATTPTVQAVPQNFEHRFEDARAANLLEVYVPFTDAGNHRALLELYVPTEVDETEHRVALSILPLLACGIVVLAIATFPLSLSLSRRLARHQIEQRAARRYGISSAEATRLAIARNIHNSVIPGLAGARMLLEMAHRSASTNADKKQEDLLEKARGMVSGEVAELQELLYQLVPSGTSEADGLEDVVSKVQHWHVGTSPRVTVECSLTTPLEPATQSVINGVAEELLRNAFRHADPELVTVSLAPSDKSEIVLVVSDNGSGISADNDTNAKPTGVGLQLSTKLLEDFGGTMTVSSERGRGTTVTAVLPLGASGWTALDGQSPVTAARSRRARRAVTASRDRRASAPDS